MTSFKGYPAKERRIGVVFWKQDDVHLLLSSRDTAMQYQFCEENQSNGVETHGTFPIDTDHDYFEPSGGYRLITVGLGDLAG